MMEKYVYQMWYSWMNAVNAVLHKQKYKSSKESFNVPTSKILLIMINAVDEKRGSHNLCVDC